jgi:hypothetical protein
MLARRGLVTRHVGGWVELTGGGAVMVGECALETKEEKAGDRTGRQHSARAELGAPVKFFTEGVQSVLAAMLPL